MQDVSRGMRRMKRSSRSIVMAALEAAIQPLRVTVARRLDWMAGSGPGHDELGRVARRTLLRFELGGVARSLPRFVMAALEAAIQPLRVTAPRRLGWMAGSGPGHDELGRVAHRTLRCELGRVARSLPRFVMAALEGAIPPLRVAAARRL